VVAVGADAGERVEGFLTQRLIEAFLHKLGVWRQTASLPGFPHSADAGRNSATGQLAAFSGTTAGAQRSCGSRRRSEIEQIVCLRGLRAQVRDGRTSTSDHEDWSVVRMRRLAILDACRNDPFVAHDPQCQRDSIYWSRDWCFEPEGGVLVAYAAKHGTMLAFNGRDLRHSRL
jgi:hypothetical protein